MFFSRLFNKDINEIYDYNYTTKQHQLFKNKYNELLNQNILKEFNINKYINHLKNRNFFINLNNDDLNFIVSILRTFNVDVLFTHKIIVSYLMAFMSKSLFKTGFMKFNDLKPIIDFYAHKDASIYDIVFSFNYPLYEEIKTIKLSLIEQSSYGDYFRSHIIRDAYGLLKFNHNLTVNKMTKHEIVANQIYLDEALKKIEFNNLKYINLSKFYINIQQNGIEPNHEYAEICSVIFDNTEQLANGLFETLSKHAEENNGMRMLLDNNYTAYFNARQILEIKDILNQNPEDLINFLKGDKE